jgi:ribonuclease BN (tRNA processing enzyme)
MSASGISPHQYLTTFLVNDHVAIDAGALGLYRSPREQAAVRHVFVSHTHIDHWATLPTFLLNAYDMADAPVTLHTSDVVLDCLKRDVFNGRVWPNFLEMEPEGKPFVKVNVIRSGQTVTIGDLRVTAVAVNHVVPTLGFILEEPSCAVVIASDTKATTEIWQRAERTPNLKAVVLEATLPNAMAELADITHHLTPAGFVGETQKLSRAVRFFAVHLSARTQERVMEELGVLRLPSVEIARFGETYEF